MTYNLKRFHEAQEHSYNRALSEMKKGRKTSCWMWYIFPQIDGLGHSMTTEEYSIKSLDEAKAYLQDEILGSRLVEISNALLENSESDPRAVMGYPDDLKLRSCMTLFKAAAGGDENFSVFQKVLDKYFKGEDDQKTLDKI